MNKEELIRESIRSYSFVSEEGVPEKYYFQFEGKRDHLKAFKLIFPQYKIYPGWSDGKFISGKSSSWYADIPLEDPLVPTLKKEMFGKMLKEVKVERHKEILKYLYTKFDSTVIEDWNYGMHPVYHPIFENAAMYVYDYTEEVVMKMYDRDGMEEYYDLSTPNLEKILEKRLKKAIIKINA